MKFIYASLFIFFLLPATYKIAPQAEAKLKSTDSLISTRNARPSEPRGQGIAISSSSAREYATEQAKQVGTPVIRALWILSHESQDCKNLYGDDGQSLGCWMISSIWNPQVGRKCSLDLVCSTAWSMPYIKTNPNMWSTWACRYSWFYNDAVTTFGLPPKNYKEPKYCK